MAGDKTYITDQNNLNHRATRVKKVTPTDIVWSSNPNDYSVQVLIDGKWHRAILTYDVKDAIFFDNINVDKALIEGDDGKNHTALIVNPVAEDVTMSPIQTDDHSVIQGTTKGETALNIYSEEWSDIEWEDNVNVYKVIVTGSDNKKHTALLTTSVGGFVQVIVFGVAPLALPDAIQADIPSLIAYGGCEQSDTPTPSVSVDITCNNGVLKLSSNLLDMSAENIVLGKYINNSGSVADSTSNFYNSKYIPVVAGETYTWSTSSSVSYFSVMEYDSGYVFKKRTLFSNAGTSDSITLRSDTAFVLIGSNIDTTDVTLDKITAINWQFEKGSSATAYKPTGIYVDGTVETINVHGKNLFNILTDDTGRGWYLTGTTVADASTNGTIVINCKPNTKYSFWHTEGRGGCRAFTMNKDTIAAGDTGVWATQSDAPTTTANTVITTYTTPADAKKLYIMGYRSGISGRSKADQLADLMVVEGEVATATAYQPYHSDTATCEDLLSVGTYTDRQEVISGVVTRNVGIKVLDGTENWIISGGVGVWANFQSIIGTGFATSSALCSHSDYAGADISVANMNQNQFSLFANGNIAFKNSYTTSTTDWTTFLATQYANGTPVIVVYPLATATTESVTGQTLQVADGDNTLEITQASLNGLELEAKYQAAVSLTIQEVQDANLDPNVEVTIN